MAKYKGTFIRVEYYSCDYEVEAEDRTQAEEFLRDEMDSYSLEYKSYNAEEWLDAVEEMSDE